MGINELYEGFKTKFNAVSGECYRVENINEVAPLLINVLQEKKAKTISLYETSLSKEANLVEAFNQADFTVHTEKLKEAAKTDDVGITEIQWGIAELGTLVQTGQEIDNRICSTLVPIHIALIKTANLLPELDNVIDLIDEMPQIPSFIGLITGPSRSSDIERILAIGVHGPKQVIAVFID